MGPPKSELPVFPPANGPTEFRSRRAAPWSKADEIDIRPVLPADEFQGLQEPSASNFAWICVWRWRVSAARPCVMFENRLVFFPA